MSFKRQIRRIYQGAIPHLEIWQISPLGLPPSGITGPAGMECSPRAMGMQQAGCCIAAHYYPEVWTLDFRASA